MKHKLSVCISISTLVVLHTRLKQGLKCMHSVCVSSQLLVSVFIAVPINTENIIFSYTHFVYFFQLVLICMQNGYDMVAGLFIMCNLIAHHNSEAITLKCIAAKITSYTQSYEGNLWSYCLKILNKKFLGYYYIQIAYQTGHAPFRSSIYVYTITRSSKTRSVNSLLQHTGKHH